MASYLHNWVDSSKGLPAELVRCFKLMQELDGRSLSLQNAINTCADQRIQVLPQADFHRASFAFRLTSIVRIPQSASSPFYLVSAALLAGFTYVGDAYPRN